MNIPEQDYSNGPFDKTGLYFFIAFAFITLMTSCSSSQKSQAAHTEPSAQVQEKKDYKTLAAEKYESNTEFIESPDNHYVLCLHEEKGSPRYPQNNLSFFVYDLKTKDIVYESNLTNGKVSWYRKGKLAIQRTPGIMREDQTIDDYISIYDLVTKEKVSKSQLEKKTSDRDF